ncbi:autotransporter outer membrane beta-barrel domain-containing protein [Actinobacillus porcinus]|uniref:autotransporter outer membrane beta-barrel domain-containing protein n=1 Tax=Actinobacillus porcinus TaxID=51048 RepID=UPI002357B0C8|nr:autotransporter outer membrane beta-barrel domain-containing protein [Actinobacillus porcinus]
MKKFQLSAITASLMFAFSNAYAADINHTCNDQTQCNYGLFYKGYTNLSTNERKTDRYWILNSNTEAPLGVYEDNLKARVVPQHYQNTAATESTTTPSYSTYLISVSNYADFNPITDKREETLNNAYITIPTGTTATLSELSGNGDILNLANVNAVIEKGVKFTLEPNFEEKYDLDDSYFSNAIHATGKHANVTTSADIIVNATEATGIDIDNEAKLTAKDHTITLNSAEAWGIEINSGAQAIINNVSISGSNYNQSGIGIGYPNSYVQVNNSSISLTNDTLTSGINLYSGKAEVNNSQIEAQYAITADAFGYTGQDRSITGNHNVINITNSTFTGRDALLSVNPDTDENPDVDQFMAHSTTLNAENSNLYGAVKTNTYSDDIQTPEWFKNNVSMTLKNSQWTINNDSEVDLLAVSKSNITFEPSSSAFKTLAITDLIGNANFTLNTDLASQQSDKIVVTGSDSGSFGLNIKDSGNEPNAAKGRVTLVETATGTAKFALLGKDYVDAGAYRYHLNQEGNNWVLSNKAGEQASPSTSANQGSSQTGGNSQSSSSTNQENNQAGGNSQSSSSNNQGNSQSSTNTGSNAGTGTSSGSGSTATPQVALSEKSNALVSLRQAQLALVESNLEGLHQRLGELKNGEKGNVWVRNVNSRNKFDSTRTASDSHSSGFEQDVHSVQLGADAALTDNIRLGGFVGNARSDVDFDGKYGSGKVKTQSLGLYGTYLANNGFYWDNVAKYEYVKSESASTGKRKYNAYTLSTEIGRIHQLGQGWTVTPQIQAAWTRLSSQSDEERLSALTARAGVRVAKAIEFDGWKLQPYAEVNGITTQTNNNQVRVNQHRFEVSDVEEGKGRFQTALGVNAAVGNHRFGLEGAITNGKYLDQPYKVQAVYRYSW